jgi:hypothetical protein
MLLLQVLAHLVGARSHALHSLPQLFFGHAEFLRLIANFVVLLGLAAAVLRAADFRIVHDLLPS